MNRTILTSLAICLPLLPIHASDTLHDYLGSDAELIVSTRSISELRDKWSQHPFVAHWEEQFAALVDLDEDDSEPTFLEILEDEFGLTEDELFEMIPGQACFALYNWVDLVANDMDAEFQNPVKEDAVLLLEYIGDEEELHRLMDVQFHRNWRVQKELNPLIEHKMLNESFMGETLYFDERFNGEETVIEDGYALVDGVFILATTTERMRSTVEAIKAGLDKPLTQDDAFLRAQEAGAGGDLSLYFNLATILPQVSESLFDDSVDANMAMVGVTAASLRDALSLESSEAVFIDADLQSDGVLFSGGLIYSDKRGLLELLAYDTTGLPSARYVPESTLSTSISSLNLSDMLANLEKMLRIASPTMLPLFDIQLAQVKNASGIDLRSALLENFGGSIVSMASMPAMDGATDADREPEQVLIMEIKDAQALSAALEALKDLAPMVRPMLKEQNYEGYTIYSLSDASGVEASEQVSYTITRDMLIICVGRIGYLQTVLTRLDQDAPGLWQAEATELLFERIEAPNPISRSYMDLSQYMNLMLQTLGQTFLLEQIFDGLLLESLPDELDAELRVVSEMNEAEDGFFIRVLLVDLEANP